MKVFVDSDVILDVLVERKDFDYYTTFDDNTSQISGKARWGNMPVVALADSKEGKKLIEEGFVATKDVFMRHIFEIRRMLEVFSDEELFEEKDLGQNIPEKTAFMLGGSLEGMMTLLSMFKLHSSGAGQYRGDAVFLYDNDGEGITNSEHLKNALDKWKVISHHRIYDGKVYVVPADVHS